MDNPEQGVDVVAEAERMRGTEIVETTLGTPGYQPILTLGVVKVCVDTLIVYRMDNGIYGLGARTTWGQNVPLLIELSGANLVEFGEALLDLPEADLRTRPGFVDVDTGDDTFGIQPPEGDSYLPGTFYEGSPTHGTVDPRPQGIAPAEKWFMKPNLE